MLDGVVGWFCGLGLLWAGLRGSLGLLFWLPDYMGVRGYAQQLVRAAGLILFQAGL